MTKKWLEYSKTAIKGRR